MAMEKVAGAELKAGVPTISGMVAQSMSRAAGGELKEYRDEDGAVMSLYLLDDNETVEFEGILKASDAETLKTKGSTFTVASTTVYITDFKIQYVNNDVAKVSGSGRTYPDLSSGGNG